MRDGKAPHWTGSLNSGATFGHFGQAGGFLWVDPAAGFACACLTDRSFGPWARDAWPRLSNVVLETLPPVDTDTGSGDHPAFHTGCSTAAGRRRHRPDFRRSQAHEGFTAM
jgi:CubicO group peptidase (beta-lactamase class C family)